MLKILIGYDGSPQAKAALADLRRAGLPRIAHARVFIACRPIFPLEALAPSGLLPDSYVKAYAHALENEEAELDAGLSQAREAVRAVKRFFPGWKIEARAVSDSPAHAILEMAQDWKADMIVLGSRGWNGFGKLIFGGVAERVMNHAACAVRLARPGPSGDGAPNLLIAYDGSPFADAAVAAVAGRTWPAGARATLLAVSDLPLRLGDAALALTGAHGKGRKGSAWPWIEGRMSKASGRLAAAGIDARTSLVIGEVRTAIVSQAKRLGANIIFLGSHGYTGLRRLMLGSVAAAVAAHAPCTVEIIRAEKKGAANEAGGATPRA